MNWISRYLTLLEVRETNRAQEAKDTLTLARDKFTAKSKAKDDAERKATTPAAIVIPDDLEAVIMEESADWLREEMRQDYRKRYVEWGDWNKVRSSVGVGAID